MSCVGLESRQIKIAHAHHTITKITVAQGSSIWLCNVESIQQPQLVAPASPDSSAVACTYQATQTQSFDRAASQQFTHQHLLS